MGEDGEKPLAPFGGRSAFPFRKANQRVAAMLSVCEDIAFRVPFGLLPRSAQGRDFWKMLKPTGFFENGESARRFFRFFGPFGPFRPNSFQGQFGKGGFDGPAKHGRFW